jgi:hypothetical protein
MAKFKLTLVSPGSGPAGPMRGGLPAFGGQAPRADRAAAGLKVPKHDHRSKKAYTGTIAGNGRPATGRKTTGGPKGPAGTTFRQVQGRKPSLMTRIGRRLGLGRLFGRRK